MERLTEESGETLDSVIEENFAKVGEISTVAVARWMAGEGAEAARETGMESWRIFGQLAAQRTAPLNEVTKRCLRWRDAAHEVLSELAVDLGLSERALDHAIAMVQRSFDVTLVRMCQSFEAERRQVHDELAHMATHDSLTGLPNRTLILDRAEQMIRRGRRLQKGVAALFIDIDNFKGINDTFGHRVGDELLRAVAARLEAVLRESDALGRLGGDEFVVVVEELTFDVGPELLAERLIEALSEPFELPGAEDMALGVTVSIGIAAGDRQTGEELVRDADIAMYQAKRDGKSRFVLFERGMQEELRNRVALEMDLREALTREQLFLVYQPAFDLDSMEPVTMEALLRWRHPSRGTLAPGEFVPVLEESGQIVEVGRWVLDEACRQVAEWRSQGMSVGVSVNVATPQLESDDFVEEVGRAIDRAGIEPEVLTLEITESSIMTNVSENERRLEQLKELGVRLAIDDFGTGYSSLAYLQRFPVDTLKIDRSFVSRLRNGPEGANLIRTVVQLGEALSVVTLAEGIERPEDLQLLREERCDAGQGFLFMRPMVASECTRYLRRAAAEGAGVS